jgi:predicted metalloprotease
MNLKGRRQSSNVDDRRSTGKKVAIGGGLGAVVIAAIMTLLNGGNMGDVVQQVANNALSGQTENYTPTAQEEEFAVFAKQILASTEDVWTAEFKKLGRTYKAPTMVLFHSSVQSGCGAASSAMGPFYCSADECLYLDLDFFNEMPKSLGAGGDFAYAYVIAHEVGHHVEHLLGILDEAHSTMSRQNETEKNKTSVRIELLADYYAGVWGYHENRMFGSLEDGDLQEAIDAAQKIGDDYLQRRARGTVSPESFTHGTSAQRMRWLKRGLQTGDMRTTTFTGDYDDL